MIKKQTKKDIQEILYSHYKNTNLSQFDIDEDLEKIYSCRRVIRKCIKGKTINEKVIINNILIAVNTFGIHNVNVLFFNILDELEFSYAKSVLIFLNCYSFKFGLYIDSNDIMDSILKDVLHRYNIFS
ncbi:MAG: hypothetical protein RSC93_00015 [Erysipelotrichaceae bacterium]